MGHIIYSNQRGKLCCGLCGGELIYDSKRGELYCSKCGCVISDISIILEIEYDRKGYVMYIERMKMYKRIKKYKKRKTYERMIRKFEKLQEKYNTCVNYEGFINYCKERGIKNNNISRHMEKLFLEYIQKGEKDGLAITSN